ncbi:hypothetical protein, partial [Brucella sp. 09RB8918]|uniref:hypothetical protein n=1 Tax=Brucella sp. 09RB8918 TaxID=1844048 RepID=UPI0019D62054
YVASESVPATVDIIMRSDIYSGISSIIILTQNDSITMLHIDDEIRGHPFKWTVMKTRQIGVIYKQHE